MRTPPALQLLPRRTRVLIAASACVVSTSSSCRTVLTQHKAHAAHGLNEFHSMSLINLPAQVGNVNINHVVERRGTVRLAPYIFGEHLASYRLSLIPKQVGEHLKLARRHRYLVRAACHPAVLKIKHQVADLLSERLGVTRSPQ